MRSLKIVLLTGTGRSTLVCAEFDCGPAYMSFKVGWNMYTPYHSPHFVLLASGIHKIKPCRSEVFYFLSNRGHTKPIVSVKLHQKRQHCKHRDVKLRDIRQIIVSCYFFQLGV